MVLMILDNVVGRKVKVDLLSPITKLFEKIVEKLHDEKENINEINVVNVIFFI